MQPEYLPFSHNGNAADDRATAALLVGGGGAGISAFVLRCRHKEGDATEPVFVTWLLNVGRFCLTVRYGRFSLKGGEWYIDGGSGPRVTPSPLEQARDEALLTREILQERLNRPLTVAPALVFFDMDPDRRIERLAWRDHVPLLWDLECYTKRLADAAAGAGLRQPLERWQALEEASALIGGAAPAGASSSRDDIKSSASEERHRP